jgi:hypothetical protein
MKIKKIAADISQLVEEKQDAYGNAFERTAEILSILYPNGIGVEQLQDAALLVRVLDKICRIAHDNETMGESPWRDICGYSLLALQRTEAGLDAEPKKQLLNLLQQKVDKKDGVKK